MLHSAWALLICCHQGCLEPSVEFREAARVVVRCSYAVGDVTTSGSSLTFSKTRCLNVGYS